MANTWLVAAGLRPAGYFEADRYSVLHLAIRYNTASPYGLLALALPPLDGIKKSGHVGGLMGKFEI